MFVLLKKLNLFRFCGNLSNLTQTTLTSTSNRMILNFRPLSSSSVRSDFKFVVKAVPSEDCASNPCHNGAKCEDIPEIETYFCNCPQKWIGQNCDIQIVDGHWTEWSEWSGCYAECGREERHRVCQEPKNGGLECSGNSTETRRCNENRTQCQGLFYCDFGVTSAKQTCNLIQDQETDELDWRLHSMTTESHYTGPDAGHTSGTPDDVYFYVEASGVNACERAIFWLPHLPVATGRYCLQFFYHMLGDWMGILNVVRVTRTSRRTIWQASGSQGDVWHRVNINILLHEGVKIGFVGIRGDGVRSDIAVDDISISPIGCYINHSGMKLLRPPKHHRRSHACFSGSKRYRVGNLTVEDSNGWRRTCYCNHDGRIDCPPDSLHDLCFKSKLFHEKNV